MKRFLSFLLALFAPVAKGESPKLGSDGDRIRQLLFACQSLSEQVVAKRPESPCALQDLLDGAKLAGEGKKDTAIAALRHGLGYKDTETRVQLWLWSGLRELGVKPEAPIALQVIGVVIEMPSGGGYDTLAAYDDGSARYLNFSGRAIFWDQADARIKQLCQNFIASTIPASKSAQPRLTLSLPKSGAQVTMLTRSGNFVISNPPDTVIKAGAALMIELMNRAREKKAASP